MLVRTIVVTVPLLLGAGEKGSTDSSKDAPETRQGQMDDSVPGHGHAAGALGNSSDTTGATGQGGAGTNAGTEGRESPRGAGEAGDTTSGARSGRWDATPQGQGAEPKRHQLDHTMTGRVAKLGDHSVTIRSQKGETRTLRLVPETRVTLNGKDAQRSELKEGQEVRASFSGEAGRDVAVKIDVRPKSGANGRSSGASGRSEPSGGGPQGGAPSR